MDDLERGLDKRSRRDKATSYNPLFRRVVIGANPRLRIEGGLRKGERGKQCKLGAKRYFIYDSYFKKGEDFF